MSEFQQQQQQPQQPQQPQQAALVYPSSTAGVKPPSHHSNGSFGAVFIVLAVIVVLSALACFLGRLCNRRVVNQRRKPEKTHGGSHSRGKEPKLHPDKEGDIEFGFDSRNPNGKASFPPGGNGGYKGNGNDNGNSHGNSFKPFDNGGEMRSEIKHADHHEVVDINFRAGGHA
ncbi:hypothetical protein SDJN02_25566, partial [Cucurbita argyrosperma subsp. argyrosperma]